jgi:hypothetical protein
LLPRLTSVLDETRRKLLVRAAAITAQNWIDELAFRDWQLKRSGGAGRVKHLLQLTALASWKSLRVRVDPDCHTCLVVERPKGPSSAAEQTKLEQRNPFLAVFVASIKAASIRLLLELLRTRATTTLAFGTSVQ